MSIFVGVLQIALLLFFILLIGRWIVNLITVFSRDWRPKGMTLLVVEGILSVTDPPIRLLRKHMPTFNVGNYRIDLSIVLLMLAVSLAISVLSAVPGGR